MKLTFNEIYYHLKKLFSIRRISCNPKKILDRMLQYLQESETGAVSYETLMNWIMDYLYEEEILKTSKVESKNMWETLKWICQEKLQVSESDIVENLNETCKQFAVYFKEASTIDALVDNVPRIIENRAITYDENVDLSLIHI